MPFFIVKPPKNNEYTYELAQAVFNSLVSGIKSSTIPFFKESSENYYSFNIISINQNIYFVAGALPSKSTHLKNQLFAQFSKSDIVEIPNFNELGEINYDLLDISQVTLDKWYGIPIKTMDKFQDVDPLTSFLSAMARTTSSNDIFWLQIILDQTNNKWQKKILSKISKLTGAEIVSESAQKEIALMQEKLKFHGFNTYIRLITNNPQTTNLLFQPFTAYSDPNGNKFTLKSAGFMRENKLREAVFEHFPYGSANILNTLELSTIWHIPNNLSGIPNIVWGKRLHLDPPENLPIVHENMTKEEKSEITFIGRTIYKNEERIFGIKHKDRMRHVYIVGKSGSGKSWLLDNMAIEDIRKGNGVAILDPHGDAIETVLDFIPKNRINDVCLFDPSDREYAYTLNILELENEHQRDIMVSGIIGIFHKLYAHSWGPRLEHILRNVLFTLTYAPDATLPDIMKILHNKKYRNKVLKNIDDPMIHQFWNKEFDQMSERFLNEAISPILNKVGQFVTSPLMRRILDKPKSKVRIEEIMNNKKILLCDLSQGKIGEDNATLLGSMIITKIQIAAMNRAFQKEEERVPFYLYVDEFQNFATSSFTKILSEARKYRLSLTMANQYITQIDPDIMNAILGNVGSLMSFNVGAHDAEILFKEFGSNIEPEDLTTLDQYQLVGRIMVDKVMSPAFTYYSLPLPKNRSMHKQKIIDQSRKRYGVKSPM